MTFYQILEKYRTISFSERDKGDRFERLMKAYLLTDPKYAYKFKKVWLWNEFPSKQDLGGNDTGIDLVALTNEGDYWAIQCKCFQEGTIISKKGIDTFFTTSGRTFKGEDLKTTSFSYRLWIDTTGKPFTNHAIESFNNQGIPSGRLGLYDLANAPLDWEKLDNGITGEVARTNKKTLRPHQLEALTNTNKHFKNNDRGKLIMACGTGKTFNSLRIAENETNGTGLILFLVPSIALLGQTLNEWYADAVEPINAICICSDPEITKNRKKLEDIDTSSVIDLAFPASTKPESILKQFKDLETKANNGLTVVFSTYQSIERISQAQKALEKSNPKYAQFDLIICDEAHRTTGVKLSDDDESSFTKVHNNDFIKAKKRLYMTATPRLYSEDTKSKAAQAEALLCSMDDVRLYGEEIYKIGFGEAVSNGLLTDYKVLILTLSEKDVPPAVQKALSTVDGKISTDDPSKLIGCINALAKQILGDERIIKETDPEPMRRAVAFCQNIAVSKSITNAFGIVSEKYIAELPAEKQEMMQLVHSKHIDGTMNATERNELLSWLKAETAENECKILTNVRCLSEGVDVPSLDAVLFLSPRNSQVEVVQSVGRVMRKSSGKKYGYIIIPIVVPADVEADKALDNNTEYKVVWDVLNALRAHDDRFDAIVNQIELNRNKPSNIIVGGAEYGFDGDGNPIRKTDGDGTNNQAEIARQLSIQFQQLQSVVFGKLVKKVGKKDYWEQWAKSVAEIATRQTERIAKIITENPKYQIAFDKFLSGLHKNINPSITQSEAIEMLSQHIITKPVFDALFENYSFVKNNPMSQSMQKMLDLLEEQSLEKDAETLEKFYQSVKTKATGIDNAEGKQRIIIELYDKFFKTAFPKLVEKLGIVYSPVEVVDFIIHSVADILKKEFGRDISDENIHILDPFTGTGTFITRLLQSGVINSRDLARKYTQEIHCNEIVLLAYYIAAINIENTFHDLQPETNTTYIPFDGICLTDTFQLGETADGEKLFSEMFPQNSKRVQRQQKTPLRIIFGNPPYSRGQEDANDNAQNQSYPKLESKISNTYAKQSKATLNRDLYNSFIKAFRWSSDRLDKNGGIIGFITGNGWIDKGGYDGFRNSLEKEFTAIYVFNLRGDIRGRSKDSAKKEGQNVFDIMTGVAITILVKNPNVKTEKATIHYHDIGDYLNRKEKFDLITKFKSITDIEFSKIMPNSENDWINQRSIGFDLMLPIEPDKNYNFKSKSFFLLNGVGISSAREPWVYGFSNVLLINRLNEMLEFYNSEKIDYQKSKVFNNDPKKISWSVNLKKDFENNKAISFVKEDVRIGLLRPFNKTNLYYNRSLIERPGIGNHVFPKGNYENKVITIAGLGNRKDFVVLMANILPDYNNYDGGTKYFPLYYYEENNATQKGMFDDDNKQDFIRRDAISDFILERAKKQYGKIVTKEDIFYYVYGFLHSPSYREMFSNDLKKMLPRLPLVEDVKDFWAFSRAGRELAELHINYETVPAYLIPTLSKGEGEKPEDYYRVEKMRFPKKDQKDTILFNSKITISNIPARAYEYVVNGKSAIEWIMERYQITTHKESGIKNDPNDWAKEVGNPKYILDLLLSIINVSVQTVDIVEGLPKVKF